MKKLFCYILVAFSLFFIGNLDVSALEVKADEIGNRTYVIGTHMFTREVNESIGYEGKLTTQHLMLASRTIEGDSLDDMIVYYKNPFGVWTNGITGEEIEVPESFNLEYKDTVELLRTPTIEQSGVGVGPEGTGIAISVDDYDGAQEVEVYYSTSEDGEYGLLKAVEVVEISEPGISVIAPSGYHYYFKVKLVKTENGITSRSEYSNILDVDSSFSEAPTISVLEYGLVGENGEKNTGLHLEDFGLIEIYYSTSEDGEYLLYSEASYPDDDFNYSVTIPLGSHYYFKARYVSADGKVVSEFSNVVDIENNLRTPVITAEFAGIDGNGDATYILKPDEVDFADEIEIFSSTSNEYGEYETKLVISVDEIESTPMVISVGEHYYFKVRLKQNVNGKDVYSDYSNVVYVENPSN